MRQSQGLLFEFTVHSPLVIRKIVAWSAFFFFCPVFPPLWAPTSAPLVHLKQRWPPFVTVSAQSRRFYRKIENCEQSTFRDELCNVNVVKHVHLTPFWCKFSPIGALKMWHHLLENFPGVTGFLLSNSYVVFNSAVSCVAVNVKLR